LHPSFQQPIHLEHISLRRLSAVSEVVLPSQVWEVRVPCSKQKSFSSVPTQLILPFTSFFVSLALFCPEPLRPWLKMFQILQFGWVGPS